mmetsp:Transcript_37247/g.90453  ORF Transcript_37247/g.90453 Transcript_37247/m.90453 type:complete len:1344 (+) Transcript_37247:273-4304(+)
MSGKEHPLDSRYDGGADEIISDSESIEYPLHSGPPSRQNLMLESNHSDIDISSCDGMEGISPDVSPVRRNRKQHKSADGLDLQTQTQRRSSRDLMGDEQAVRKESLHLTDPSQLSDEDLSQQDSFADANSNEIVTDDDMSISDDEVDDDDYDDYDDDFDEDGYYKYSEDQEFEYHDTAYHSESDDEITVEDALATIMEGEEEEESEEEEEESDEEDNGTNRGGSIHQSLYRFKLMQEEEEEEESNHSVEVYEMALGGEAKAPPKKVRNPIGYLEEEEEDLNDSGYFMNKEPLYANSSSMESGPLWEEENDILNLLRTENWESLKPFLNKLRNSEDEYIRDELTKMDTFGTTKMYPIHFIVWRAPNSFIKNFISSIPYMYQSETLSRLDSFGNSPLHLACSGLEVDVAKDSIDVSVVEIISECGPETHEMLNKQGESPLALLMNSKALKADPAKLSASEVTAERLVRSMLEGRTNLVKRKNMFDYKTLLHTAASFGVHEAVLIALLELTDPSIAAMEDTSKRIPLHYIAGCVSEKRPQVLLAEKLLEADKEGVIRTTTTGETPLHVYVSNITQRIKDEEELNSTNTTKMTEILLGSKEDEAKCPLLMKNSTDLSPLHCCALYNAPMNVMEQLSKSPFFEKAATITDSNSATPLHLACASSKIRATLEKVKFFGTAEAAVMRDKKSRTPMHVAAENPKMTKYFIKALVDINPKAAKVRNSKGRMPLHIALRKNAKDSIIKALLKANPKAVKTTFSGRNSVFHEMCEYKTSAPVMKAILKMHPSGSKVKNKLGNLPLHEAISFECSINVVQELLDAYPGGATAKNKNGETPLHLAAASKKSLEVVQLLLSVGPKATIITNKDGQKPLDTAKLVEGNDEVVSVIEAKTNEYREERAQQKAKVKERRSAASKERRGSRGDRKKKRASRSSRSRSHSADLEEPEEEVAEVVKKPSSLSKIMSRSSGSKHRRRASGGDPRSSIDPEPKQEKGPSHEKEKKPPDKRPLRRMLKSFTHKVGSPLQGGKPKKDMNSADVDKKKSDHSPKEKARRGLPRSKSDRGLRVNAEEKEGTDDVSLRRKLKPSRSFKFSKKSAAPAADDEDNNSRSRSRRSLFPKMKRRSSAGDGDHPNHVNAAKNPSSKETIGSTDDTTPTSLSPLPARKIRSGRKRDSKASNLLSQPPDLDAPDSKGSLESGSRSSNHKRKSHKSPKRKSKPDSLREESKPTSESSLTKESSDLKPKSESSVSKHGGGTESTAESSLSKHGTSVSSQLSRSTAESSSSVSKHGTTTTTAESSASLKSPAAAAANHAPDPPPTTAAGLPVDPPPETNAGPRDPPSNDERSVETADEWF